MSPADDVESLLAKYPKLRHCLAELLHIAENTAGDLTQADDAEDRVVASVRQLGREVLSEWAQQRESAGRTSSDTSSELRRDKKTLLV